MSKVRVSIVGLGAIAMVAHLESYARRDDVEIVAFVDLESERVKKAARQFADKTGRNEPRVYGSIEEMMQSETVDAVSICTPNRTHSALTIEALRHGLHVLVEKPLCIDLSEANQILEAEQAANRIVMVGMSHRYRSDVEVIRRFVDAGDFGDIYYGKVRILRRRGVPQGWFTDQSVSGGGPLMDLGVHALDLAWWLMGTPSVESANGFMTHAIGHEPLEFTSRWSALSSGNENNQVFTTEDFASAFVRFSGGSVLQMEVSWAMNGPEDGGLKMELFGTKGGVALDPLRVFRTEHGILTTTMPVVPERSLYDREIAHFIECVKEGTQPLSDARQGREIVRMLNMVSASANQSKEVRAL